MRTPVAPLVVVALLASSVGWAQPSVARGRAMPQYKLGLEDLRAERWQKAVESFQRAIDLDPTFEMAYYALGRATMPQKHYADAVAALTKCRDLYREQAGKQFSNEQDARRYRQERLTEIDELMRGYQQAQQTAQVQEAMRQLGERRRQLQENLQRGTSASLDDAVPSYVSLALGSALFRLGRLNDAEREYKAAVAADAKTGEAHSNLAVVYLETGRFDEAEKAVKAAEKTGFKVNPMLKDDIAAKKKGGQ